MRNYIYIFISGALMLSFSGCKDLLVKEPDGLLPSTAIQNEDDLQEVLISAYDVLANTYNGNSQNLANLLSDNVARPIASAEYESIWLRSSTIFNGFSNQTFLDYYIAVLRSNTVLDNLSLIEVDADISRRATGEAHFIRALCHFDVCRAYAQPYELTGDNSHPGVAIRSSSDIIVDAVVPRSSVGEVYSFVLDNIQVAKDNLPIENDVYATYYAAVALEAAVRFQMHDYQAAYDLADEVIASGQFMFAEEYPVYYTFPFISEETIFGIFTAPLANGFDTRNGGFRGQWNSQGSVPNLQIPQDFFSAITEDGGPRSELYEEVNQDGNLFWVTNKFNETNFNIPIFTLTQMMLIRAESAAIVGQDLSTPINDINRIRERAYGSPTNNLGAANADQVIEAAQQEMRFEFPFTGQRTHDLKRRGAQGEMIIVRGAPWDCPANIIQFPATEATSVFPLNPGGGC
jgi:hypothetical protein